MVMHNHRICLEALPKWQRSFDIFQRYSGSLEDPLKEIIDLYHQKPSIQETV